MLSIYRASAGAGKTHLLTGEYIKLLFRKDLLPESADHETQFNEILAVTFTNKSTAEMKSRIVKELNVLSENPAHSDYYDEVRFDGKGGTLSDVQIRSKAKAFLTDILNNYSDFAISTIDSFFQKIIRSFARELNLQYNYEVELNSNRILDAAISNFLDKLDRNSQETLFSWLLQFSQKKIEDGAGWRLENDLKQMAKSVLTSEDYRARSESIKRITTDKNWLKEYVARLDQIVYSTKARIKALGEKGREAIANGGLTVNDFKGGARGKMRIFESWCKGEMKEPDDTIGQWAETDEAWYTKTSKIRLDADNAQTVKELLSEAIDMRDSGWFVNYNTAMTIRDNIYQLGILADIDKEVNEYCNAEGTLLLSSTTEMLNKLIGEDEAPFIYEKTGTRIHSFMIDEFQDTSQMQWNNFRPLIENSLADGRQNLIVGDVKQSIYRWRGSDWGLLHSGLKRFAVGQSREDTETLTTNYRSQREIITFNNAFFKFISSTLSSHYGDPNIDTIYSDVYQEIPKKKKDGDAPGLVNIRFIAPQDDEKFEALAMQQLPQVVMQLEDSGFAAKDIAILCRTKALCKQAADALLAYKSNHPDTGSYVFDIISSEALLLSSRHIIQTIISILRFIQKPSSTIFRAIASCQYLQECGMSQQEAVSATFGGDDGIDQFRSLANRPLYDMTEGIISLLPSASRDVAYVQAFRDCVLDFANSKKADISAFLEWWDQYGGDLCINTPEGQNAIRIMTIHKSKGLGMPAVILPCCYGTTDMTSRGGDILWCEPKTEPFYEEGLFLPIKCSKALTNTIFSQDYQEERLKAIIDNLNTIYVAFTRAKEAMVIMTPLPGDKTNADTQEALLYGFAKQNHKEKLKEAGGITDCVIGEYRRKDNYLADEESQSETISQGDEDSALQRKLPRLALKHDKLTKDVEAIERGNCIHEALSAIIDRSDIDQPIEDLYRNGRLGDELFTCDEMKAEIHRLMDIEEIGRWFAPGQKVLNEKTILARSTTYDGREQNLHRPDRIVYDGKTATVIDYKTGEHQRKHYAQVREYMTLLRQMGFSKVEGYLWYIYPHQVVKVENKGYKKA